MDYTVLMKHAIIFIDIYLIICSEVQANLKSNEIYNKSKVSYPYYVYNNIKLNEL